MKRLSQCGCRFLGLIVVAAALAGLARSDDSAGSTSQVTDESLAQAPSAPGPVSAPGQAGVTAPASPAPDSSTAPTREEGATNQAASFTPNMLGDQGGGHPLNIVIERSDIGELINLGVPSPSAGVLGRQRIADNDCVLPTDRVFCDYSYFHDAYLTAPTDANRFVPGFEKTFLDGRTSVEMRFPMGVMASNNMTADSTSLASTGQFGDIQLIFKAILLQEDTWTLDAGLGVSIPTAPDFNLEANPAHSFLPAGTPLLQIANRSTHLLPFVGLLVKPDDDWFAQAFVQLDVAASGDPVAYNIFAGNYLTPSGTIYDQTMIFADVSIGRWLYRNPGQRFSALAAVVEAHYTGGLNAPSAVGSPYGFSVGYNTAEYNVLDLVIGAHAVVGQSTITLGFATPLTDDRGFDGELRLFVNRRF